MLSAKLGDVITAGAEVLELHARALNSTEPDARTELEAYLSVARQHRTIARERGVLAGELAAYLSLPMAVHDEEALADPRAGAVFERFVQCEEELVSLLRARLEEDRHLLGMIQRR